MAQKYDLSIVFKVINQATAPIKAFQKQLQDAMKPVSGMGQSFSRFAFQAREHLSSLGNYLTNFTGKVVSVGKSFASMGKESLIALGGITAGIGASILGVTGYADDLGDLAANLGISTTQLQKWRFAAEMTGSSAEKLDQGLSFFVRTLGDARKGSGDAYEALKKLEIGLTDGQGNFKTTAQMMSEISDKIASMSEQEGFDVTASFFGRGSTELFSMMKLGSTGIRQFGEDLKRVNGIMSEEFIEASGSFQDSFNKLKKVILSFITTALTPTIEKLTEITDGLVSWSKENPKAAKTITELAKIAGIFLGIMAPLALIIGGASLAIGAMGGTAFLAAAGISALVAILADMAQYKEAGLMFDFLKELAKAEYKKTVKDLTDLGKALGKVYDSLVKLGQFTVDQIITAWNSVSGFFVELWSALTFEFDWFIANTKAAWNDLIQWFSGVEISAFFRDLWNGLIPDWVKNKLGIDLRITPPAIPDRRNEVQRPVMVPLQKDYFKSGAVEPQSKERVEVSLRVSTDKDSQVLISNIDKTAGTNFNLISESYLGTLFQMG